MTKIENIGMKKYTEVSFTWHKMPDSIEAKIRNELCTAIAHHADDFLRFEMNRNTPYPDGSVDIVFSANRTKQEVAERIHKWIPTLATYLELEKP